jgi:hypothetical protein
MTANIMAEISAVAARKTAPGHPSVAGQIRRARRELGAVFVQVSSLAALAWKIETCRPQDLGGFSNLLSAIEKHVLRIDEGLGELEKMAALERGGAR